jgi:hypothetical protein
MPREDDLVIPLGVCREDGYSLGYAWGGRSSLGCALRRILIPLGVLGA